MNCRMRIGRENDDYAVERYSTRLLKGIWFDEIWNVVLNIYCTVRSPMMCDVLFFSSILNLLDLRQAKFHVKEDERDFETATPFSVCS
jgi:hypothetical protein